MYGDCEIYSGADGLKEKIAPVFAAPVKETLET